MKGERLRGRDFGCQAASQSSNVNEQSSKNLLLGPHRALSPKPPPKKIGIHPGFGTLEGRFGKRAQG